MIDRNKILKIITNSPVFEILSEIRVKPIELMGFYNNLEFLLKTNIPYGEVGNKFNFCIALPYRNWDEIHEKWNILDKDTLVSKIKEGLFSITNIIFCDLKGNVIKISKGKYVRDFVEASNFSEEKSCLVFFINYMELYICLKGKLFYYTPNIFKPSRVGVSSSNQLPAREYRQLIKNHYNTEVYKEKGGFKYWKSKAKRILIDSPEINFNKNLYSYLKLEVVDSKVDRGAAISGMEDRTDIRIMTLESGEIYIVEIKCLGKTESTKYSDAWANRGLIQLTIYLTDEEDSKTGVLVLYDGRKENKDIVWNPKIKWHPKMDRNPMKFFLESESAAVKTKKIYSRIKKKKL